MLDRRRKYFLLLDVETANTILDPLIYDIGFIVADKQGNIYEKGSWIIKEIFHNYSLMNTAYYREKVPQYQEGLRNGEHILISFFSAKMMLRNKIRKYNIKEIYAYNAGFDRRAFNKTERYLNKSRFRWFFPYGVKFRCIWNMACTTIFQQKTFYKHAERYGWISEKGNYITNAEVAYRYITKQPNFQEEHKGLSDVLIELEIMLRCLAQHKKMDKHINANCWRLVQPI